MTTPAALPNYKKPPVVEVVCGVLFDETKALKAPHLGQLWSMIRSEFPSIEEQPLLSSVVEVFGPVPPPTIEITGVPPLTRVWFINKGGDRLIQMQRDRFLFNWRRLKADEPYPHFESVYADFTKYLNIFREFLDAISAGPLAPRQYELTYVNHIDGAVIDNSVSNLGRVFRDYAWQTGDRWLPPPNDSMWRTSFDLPDQTGRLHSTVHVLKEDQGLRRALRFELTARGIADESLNAMKTWFQLAHEWIVRGFTDLTTRDIQQELWERIDA